MLEVLIHNTSTCPRVLIRFAMSHTNRSQRLAQKLAHILDLEIEFHGFD